MAFDTDVLLRSEASIDFPSSEKMQSSSRRIHRWHGSPPRHCFV
jgi:hypothetical protein